MRRERLTITIRTDVVHKIDTIIDGDSVRNRSNAIETIVLKHFQHHILNKAVMLAGGPGVKINGQTMAKVLMPIKDRTLLEKNLAVLKSYGVSEVVLSTQQWTKDIKKIFGNGEKHGIKIDYYDEGKSGTAGILLYARKKFKETFFMMNGDILLEGIDIEDMYNYHKKQGGRATVSVASVSDPTGLGSIIMKGPKVARFSEKTSAKELRSHLVSGGVYFLEPEVCGLAKDPGVTIERHIFPALAEKGDLYGYQLDQRWVHLHDQAALHRYLKSAKSI